MTAKRSKRSQTLLRFISEMWMRCRDDNARAMMDEDAKRHDPRNLIGDALIMEGLTVEENRSIFFDWAFGLKMPDRAAEAAQVLLDVYRTPETAAHPMITLLEQAAQGPAKRQGRTNRRRQAAKRWDALEGGAGSEG